MIIWSVDKKKESIDKQKRLPIEGLALAMIQYGSDLHEDSAYGTFSTRIERILITCRPGFSQNGSIRGKDCRETNCLRTQKTLSDLRDTLINEILGS